MLKIKFDNRAKGRRFLKLCRKHSLFKMYLNKEGWEDGGMSFKFDNEEQKNVISGIIFNVLKEMGIDYTKID